ncbi:YdcF family protein [Spirochaeta africana]|uniref:DUF218 domain-containing protein n=1 Tax=Spirochaeta africana (strain ATCC 700263 / DSM 8902 / Z-7692) TaxID=889378 RepID=H9UJR8_SPIAZ|nr:ElyC/SanA/YdcF family protein [Spirochaeta africana]AFG37761.1 hypothetical protein Spiaf_1704 [Spirochaeta africana DSM 8902]
MRILLQFAASLLWPPGSLIILLILCSLLALRLRRRSVPAVLLGIAALLIYLLSIEPTAHGMLRNLESRSPGIDLTTSETASAISMREPGTGGAPAPVIVVLGADMQPGSPDGVALGSTSLTRSAGGLLLHRQTGARIIAAGGPAGIPWGSGSTAIGTNSQNRENHSTDTPAEAIAAWLAAAGIARDRITTEGSSRTTAEAARNIMQLLAADSPPVMLVTSAYHMPRALYSFREYQAPIVPVPVDYRANRTPIGLQSFLPDLAHLHNSTTALREFAILAAYAVGFWL